MIEIAPSEKLLTHREFIQFVFVTTIGQSKLTHILIIHFDQLCLYIIGSTFPGKTPNEISQCLGSTCVLHDLPVHS